MATMSEEVDVDGGWVDGRWQEGLPCETRSLQSGHSVGAACCTGSGNEATEHIQMIYRHGAAMTPHQFLRELGITKNSALQEGSEEYVAEIRRTGLDPAVAERDGAFSPGAMDLRFANERVARATLSCDFDRLREHMEQLRDASRFPKNPHRIADLGGGVGVVAMFLARQHPQAQVTVYDWSPRSLEIGRKWAGERAIRNIEFRLASYDALAVGPEIAACDAVLLLHGIPLDTKPPTQEDPFLWGDVCQDGCGKPGEDMRTASQAMARLLSPSGIGIISGGWTEWGALNCFEALHLADLSLDWSLSFTKGRIHDSVYTAKAGYAFVGRHVPRIARNSSEEARAFFACGELDETDLVFSTGITESMARLFNDGQELLCCEATFKTGGMARVRLLYKAGLLLLEDTTTHGARRCCLKSLAGICGLLKKADLTCNVHDGPDIRISRFLVDPALDLLVKNYPALARHQAAKLKEKMP